MRFEWCPRHDCAGFLVVCWCNNIITICFGGGTILLAWSSRAHHLCTMHPVAVLTQVPLLSAAQLVFCVGRFLQLRSGWYSRHNFYHGNTFKVEYGSGPVSGFFSLVSVNIGGGSIGDYTFAVGLTSWTGSVALSRQTQRNLQYGLCSIDVDGFRTSV